MSDSVQPHRWQPTRLPCLWDSPGKNTGVGCHFLLQCMKGKVKVKSLSHVRLFATPWTIAYQAPVVHGIFQARVLEWVAISFSRASSQPRDRTGSPILQADTLPSEPPRKPITKCKSVSVRYYFTPIRLLLLLLLSRFSHVRLCATP